VGGKYRSMRMFPSELAKSTASIIFSLRPPLRWGLSPCVGAKQKLRNGRRKNEGGDGDPIFYNLALFFIKLYV